MEFRFLDESYRTMKIFSSHIREPSKYEQPLARLKERHANRRLCSGCRKIVREAAISRCNTYSTVKLDFHSLELLERTKGRNCPFCFLFVSILSDYKRSLVDLNESVEKWIGGVPTTVTFIWSDDIMPASRFPKFEGFSEIYFQPQSMYPLSLVDPKGLRVLQIFQPKPLPKEGLDWISRRIFTNKRMVNGLYDVPRQMQGSSFYEVAGRQRLFSTHKTDRYWNENTSAAPPSRFERHSSGVNLPHSLTLSHCWGTVLPNRLLISNIEAMRESIHLEELSQTFQDALSITSMLGMRYIWIDALCIIQDSKEDWQRESARMCDVYSNSYCNIAATVASDGSRGIFRQRDARLLKTSSITLGNVGCNLVNNILWLMEIEEAPLSKRAWVCQERILSPRNIHFALTQVFWECNESSACEQFPGVLPTCMNTNISFMKTSIKTLVNQKMGKPREKPPAATAARSDESARKVRVYRSWDYIIEMYSQCALTYETDKLIALGGIAASIQSVLDDESCYAGLWRRFFAYDLLWTCRWPYNTAPLQPYLAPSWSWASVNCPVKSCFLKGIWDYPQNSYYLPPDDLEHPTEEILISIKMIDIERETENIFGQVRRGAIHLQGKLLEITLPDGADAGHATIRADCIIPASCHIWADDGRQQRTAEKPPQSPPTAQLCVLTYCLPVIKREHRLEGLLIERTFEAGNFRRVGVFEALYIKEHAEIGMQCFDSKAEESGLKYYDDGEGGYKYAITLI